MTESSVTIDMKILNNLWRFRPSGQLDSIASTGAIESNCPSEIESILIFSKSVCQKVTGLSIISMDLGLGLPLEGRIYLKLKILQIAGSPSQRDDDRSPVASSAMRDTAAAFVSRRGSKRPWNFATKHALTSVGRHSVGRSRWFQRLRLSVKILARDRIQRARRVSNLSERLCFLEPRWWS